MNIIILGPQGSGKGTQAKSLSEKFGLFYLESGSVLRDIAKKDSRINEIVNKEGKLLPDKLSSKIILDYLGKKALGAKNIVFDGFPRSIDQYKLLRNWLKKRDSKIDKAFFLQVSEEVSLARLSARRTCEKCGRVYNLITNPPTKGVCKCGGKLFQRDDDREDAIKTRLTTFRKTTLPLVKLLKKEKILILVDGEKSIAEIFADILKNL